MRWLGLKGSLLSVCRARVAFEGLGMGDIARFLGLVGGKEAREEFGRNVTVGNLLGVDEEPFDVPDDDVDMTELLPSLSFFRL